MGQRILGMKTTLKHLGNILFYLLVLPIAAGATIALYSALAVIIGIFIGFGKVGMDIGIILAMGLIGHYFL